jgi:hypothetical protein
MYFFTFPRYEKCSFLRVIIIIAVVIISFKKYMALSFFTAQLVKQKSIHCFVNDIALYPLHQWMDTLATLSLDIHQLGDEPTVAGNVNVSCA